MNSTIYRKHRVTIPKEIRSRHGIKSGDKLTWIDTGESIIIIPNVPNPISALYGKGRGEGLLKKLLEERAKEGKRSSSCQSV